MKYIFFLSFLLIVACGTGKKEYVCGDHLCIDKKEFKEYFAKNLTVEILTQPVNKKKETYDLVKLNTASSDFNKKNKIFLKKEEKLRLKEEKVKLKKERLRLKEERKIKEIKEKNKIIEEKKLAKLSKSNKNADNVVTNETIEDNTKNVISKNKIYVKETTKETKPSKKEVTSNSIKTENTKTVCDEIKDCDIDKIAELLIKKGRAKDFPNITSD